MVDDIVSIGPRSQVAWAHQSAAPWILGLYALAGATFVMATRWASGYSGNGAESQFLLLPFSAVLGGITLLAAMWAVEAADGLASAIFGTWGAFWIAYGLLEALFARGKLSKPTGEFTEMGVWFIVIAAITWAVAMAALSRSMAAGLTFGFLAAGSTVAAIANIAARGGLQPIAGCLFIISAVVGSYTATGMMFEQTFRRAVLPLGAGISTASHAREWIPERSTIIADVPAGRRVG